MYFVRECFLLNFFLYSSNFYNAHVLSEELKNTRKDQCRYLHTGCVLCSGTVNGNYQITDFRLGISKKNSNIISITIKNT